MNTYMEGDKDANYAISFVNNLNGQRLVFEFPNLEKYLENCTRVLGFNLLIETLKH